MPNYKGYTPPDLEATNSASAESASSTSANSFTKSIDIPLVAYKRYQVAAAYEYEDPETKQISLSGLSPWLSLTFDIPNKTLPVTNVVLTGAIKSYGIKFTLQSESEHADIIIFESLTGAFAGEEYIVYTGTSTSVTIPTSDFAPRWVKIRTRDQWEDENKSDVIAGPVTPLNADPDTTTAPTAPTGASVSGFLDSKDITGFKAGITASWTAKTDNNTSGYVIRWTTQNPATTQNPVWEYGQVEGKATTTFTITGLVPNTLYYWQVTAKSPYNAISWASPQSGTVGPIVDSTMPSDAWAQLRSIISIGGKTADLFKFGTGITQDINTSVTTTPSLTNGTYSGIILNKSTTNVGHNYWLNTGQFRVGSATAFLYWDGSDLYTTGKINATGGVFSGNVQVSTGTIYAGASPDSGARVRMNSAGLFAYDSNNNQVFSVASATGALDARSGYIGGWNIQGSSTTTGSISKNGTILDSSGNITLGDTTGTLASIVKLSSTDATYRLWVGSQTASNAPFRVTKAGVLYATGAVFTGSSIDGYATTAVTTGLNTRLTAVENNYVTSTSLNTKNAIFVTTSTPTATKVGDIWIHESTGVLKTWTGSTWTQRTDTTYATKTALDTKLEVGGYLIANAQNQVTSINSNGITITSSGFKINTDTTATAGANMVILNSQGIASYDSTGSVLFSINSNGNAVFKGNITGASGTFSGRLAVNTATDTSAYIDSAGSLSGITGLVVGSIGFKNTSIGGWTSHCYPYMPGSPNIDLGTTQFRWNDVRTSGRVFMGHGGSDTITNVTGQQPYTVFLSNGRIYANTLGTGTGTSLVQDSSGYIRVSSSSRRYKENISEITNVGYLDAVNLLKPVKFSYKVQEEDIDDTPGYETVRPLITGLIAEDVEEIEILKDLVNYNTLGETEGLAYDRLTAVLTLAIQEISNKINNLTERLDAIGA